MTPEEELELLKLRKRKLEMEKQRTATSGEGEGSDDSEGETTPPPSKAGETTFDAIQGGTRGVTLGLNDVVAGLGAAAGDLYQSTVDGRPRNPDAYSEGVAEERARDEASRQRSPRAFKRAELAGLVATAPVLAAKPVQLAARSASGAPIALGAVADAAAPALARYGRAAGVGALTGLGLGDVDKVEDVPGAAATGAALGLGGEALASAVKSGMATGISPADLARTGSLKGADALKSLIGKVDDATGVELPMFGGREAEKVLRRLGAGAADLPPPPTIPQDRTTYEFMQSLGDEFAPLPPSAPVAPAAKTNPLAALADEPMPTMPPRNPRTPADQIPKAADPIDELVTARMPPASEPASTVIPVVTKNSSAGNIAQAVEAKAVELGTTDLATIANALKLPTTLVADPLKNAVSRFAFREAVKASAGKAAPVADDAAAVLKEIAAEGRPSTPGVLPDEAMAAINQAKREVPRSLLPGDRPMSQVAGANQGAEMRAAYQALTPEQRVQWIQYLRGQGYPDEKIRTMLGVTQRDWRAQAFNRLTPTPRSGPTGGEGESEALTDEMRSTLLRNASDAIDRYAPWAKGALQQLPEDVLEELARVAAGTAKLPTGPVGSLSPQSYTRILLRKAGVTDEPLSPIAALLPSPVKKPPTGKVFYHTTSAANLDDIASSGLTPNGGGRGTFGQGYDANTRGRIFLADDEVSARTWAGKISRALEDQFDPGLPESTAVMLRVRIKGKTQVDAVGSRDVRGTSFTDKPVPPDDLEFWDGSKWLPVSQWSGYGSVP